MIEQNQSTTKKCRASCIRTKKQFYFVHFNSFSNKISMQFEIKNVADKSTSYNTERKSNEEKKIANKFYKFKNDFAQNTSLDVYFFDFVDFIVAA